MPRTQMVHILLLVLALLDLPRFLVRVVRMHLVMRTTLFRVILIPMLVWLLRRARRPRVLAIPLVPAQLAMA